MRKRYLVLGFSVLLALAVAVPAIGQSSDPTATTSFSSKKKERKQNKRIRKAKQKAKKAKNIADQALALAQQNEGDITTLNTRVTALEAVPGGPGPQGPAGEQGEPGTPGTPGTAGPGQSFTLFLDDDNTPTTIDAGGFSLRFNANAAGVCADAVLVVGPEAVVHWTNQDGNNQSQVSAASVTLANIAPSDAPTATDGHVGNVTAAYLNADGSAQFEFAMESRVDDTVSGDDQCVVTGTVISS